MSKRELGVVIARFQTPTLTDAHKYLLEQVSTRCDRALVLLGVAPAIFTKRNPLEYALRRQMLIDWWADKFSWHKELEILPLRDEPDDHSWARQVDDAIAFININGPATIYCGPDGAGPTYTEAGGKWPVEVLDSMGGHASKVRYELTPRRSEDFRAGVIYAVERRFNNPLPVIDMIIKDIDHGEMILLGQKKIDGGKWRLIGGFVDPADVSLEAAVKREAHEETHLEVDNVRYLGSCRVDDWRYRDGPEVILSGVFLADKIFGQARASDDIEEVMWVHKDQVEAELHPIHLPLWALTKGKL